MSEKINIRIFAGNTATQIQEVPTVISSNTPYFRWVLPEGVVQRRFNLRIKAQESVAEFVLGETVSSQNTYQWPYGIPMTNLWLGLVHIEVVVSASSSIGGDFEYTSGQSDNYFVYDTIAEDIFNTEDVVYRWKNSIDPDFGQSIYYNVLVAKDPLFNPASIILDANVEDLGGTLSQKTGDVEYDNAYFWKVRAYDGIDYSNWTVVNGFRVIENDPPVVEITNVYVLNNDYGDVVIEFTTLDNDDDYISVICTYTGGNQGLEEKNCSIINSLNKVPNGDHFVIWRSSRDEQLIESDDYIVYMRGWDDKSFGIKDSFGPFEMDNRRFGREPGGFGSIDIEFPLFGYLVRRYSTGYDLPQEYPNKGYITSEKDDLEDLFLPVYGDIGTYKKYMLGGNFLPSGGPNSSFSYIGYPPDYTGSGQNGSGSNPVLIFKVLEDEDETDDKPAPSFTDNIDDLDSNGYPKYLDYNKWSDYRKRYGYIKKYHVEIGYSEPDPDYGYKNFKVVYSNGKYVREEINNGKRGIGGILINIGVPTYVPISDILTPDDDERSSFFIDGYGYRGKYQYILGNYGDETWPTGNYHTIILGTITDPDTPKFIGRFFKKVYSDYDLDKYNYYTFIGYIKLAEYYKIHPSHRMEGALYEQALDYFAGYPAIENEVFETRPQPPYPGDRGFTIIGNLRKEDTFENLSIIYLQRFWDAYNTVHWQATLGYTTKIHLQYTEYYNDTDHGPWLDLITKDVNFDEDVLLYLVEPLRWHAYLDTLNPGVFKDNTTYRFRIRMVDPYSQTFSPFVFSAKFTIDHEAVNPANVLSTSYEPWNKEMTITFRIDDTQGDLYDLIAMDYSSDGRTFYPIEMKHVRGIKSFLESNTQGDLVDENDIIIHNIIWNTSSYSLTPSDNYRIRLYVTNTSFIQGIDKPVFSWWIFNNTTLRYVENKITSLLGKSQLYYWDEENDEWVKDDNPRQIPGVVQNNIASMEEIKSQPLPSGVYQFYEDGDETKPLIDPSGYQEWRNTDLGGLTRAEILNGYEEQNQEIFEDILPDLYGERDSIIIKTRRNLIKQGYYNNGYIDNNPSNEVFRYRVESQPYDDTEQDDVFYSDRWEAYFRIQIDFFDTYDSQEGGYPLRDIYFHDDGSRIQAGPSRSETLVDSGTNWNIDDSVPTAAEEIDNPDQTGVPWEGEDSDSGGDGTKSAYEESTIYTETPSSFDTRGYGTYRLPKSLLPGERTDYYISSTYQSVNDVVPDGIEDFNYHYYWRIAAYNIVSGTRREVARPLITNVEVQPSSDRIKITYLACADETVSSMTHDSVFLNFPNERLVNIQYSLSSKTPTWYNKESLSFPTDRPNIVDDRIITTCVPEGTDRARPWVLITDDHQYYLWHAKKNLFDDYIIMHSMGKSYKIFGDYAQCFPFLPTKDNLLYGSASAYYAPIVIQDDGVYHMWCTGLVSGVNKIFYTYSDNNFDDWEQVEECDGLEGCYYPSVMKVGSDYYMWVAKFDGSYSRIYLFSSPNKTDWTVMNSGNYVFGLSDSVNAPCVIKIDDEYIMYFTEFSGSNMKISSVKSIDGVSWNDYAVEIDGTDVYNPCVVVDRLYGNEVYRMYYNQKSNDDSIIKTAYLDDRNWNTCVDHSMYGDWKNVSSTISGIEHYLYIKLSDNNLGSLTENSEVMARLKFNVGGSKNYYIQSEWIDINTDDKYEIFVSPEGKFRYGDIYKSLDY